MTEEIVPFTNTENTISNLFFQVLKDDSNKMEQDVTAVYCDVLNVIEFKQNKPYRLSEEQYNKWPKIYSISLDQNNKQIVTLEFRNYPNLIAIKNILHLYSAEYVEQTHSMPLNGKLSSINTIRIEKNSLMAIANLIYIYGKMSTEAAALIWESFIYIVEDSMDKNPDNPRWKEGVSYLISAWSESSQNLDEDSCSNTPHHYFYDTFEHNAKLAYSNLSTEYKQKFLKAIISHFVKLNAAAIFENLPHNNKYQIIEDAFNTIEKCNKYIYGNLHEVQTLSNVMQERAVKEFDTKFEPTFLETVFSDKASKHVKYGGTGLGAGISLLDKLGILGKKMPIVQTIFAGIDLSKVVYSLVYANKEISAAEKETKPIDITDLSRMIICKDIICNHQILQSLTEESLTKLIKFYSEFVYNEIKNNPSINSEEYLSSYLIKKMSNPEAIEKLGLVEKAKTPLEKDNGETITIAELIFQYNQTTCYDEILKVLSGEKDSLSNLNSSNIEQNNTMYIEYNNTTNTEQLLVENIVSPTAEYITDNSEIQECLVVYPYTLEELCCSA